VAALYQCIFIALYVRKKCNLKTALFVAFNLVHAKNCIIRRSDGIGSKTATKFKIRKDLIFSCARGLTHFRYHSKSLKLYAFVYVLANLRLDLILANIQADFLKQH
jgi:hypothetical protein